MDFFFKSRDFPLFSKMRMKVYSAGPEQAGNGKVGWLNLLICEMRCNPFGKRSLEEDWSFHLQDASIFVRQKLQVGELPKEEDMEQFRRK